MGVLLGGKAISSSTASIIFVATPITRWRWTASIPRSPILPGSRRRFLRDTTPSFHLLKPPQLGAHLLPGQGLPALLSLVSMALRSTATATRIAAPCEGATRPLMTTGTDPMKEPQRTLGWGKLHLSYNNP